MSVPRFCSSYPDAESSVRRNIVKLIVSLAAPLLAGAVGAIATNPEISGWYANLAKPAFSPPNWLFGPAWTTLYILMGVALFLVWRKGWHIPLVRTAMIVFGVQLVLNVVWSWLFFGLHSPFTAFLEIIPLWLAIALTGVFFCKVSRPAGILLIPYFIWVSFAMALNYAIWSLNR